jgi:hypothetical protein
MLDVPTEFLTNVARTCNVGDQKEKTACQTFTDGSRSEPDRQPFKSDEEPIEGEIESSIFIVDTQKTNYFGSVCHNTTTTMRETERGGKRKTSLVLLEVSVFRFVFGRTVQRQREVSNKSYRYDVAQLVLLHLAAASMTFVENQFGGCTPGFRTLVVAAQTRAFIKGLKEVGR